MFYFLNILYILLGYKIISRNLSPIREESIISKNEINVASFNNHNFSEQINNKYIIPKRKLSESKKNLILGVILKYDWKIIQPYFKSFESVGFENCDWVMFVSKLSESTIRKIESFGVIIKDIPFEYLYMNINKMRWKLYLDYLNENIDKYKLILSTDVRDTIFQLDLFQIYAGEKQFLGVSLEGKLFLYSIQNKGWFINAFGEDEYKKIVNEDIICAGAVWGTADKFLLLANKIWEKAKNRPSLTKLHDQSIISYIVYIEKIFDDCLIKSGYKDGYVLTIGRRKTNVSLDSEGNILNEKGEIAAVVHQYDRVEYYLPIMRKRFCIEGKVNITKKYKKIQNFNLKKFVFIFFIIIDASIIIIFILSIYISKRKIRKYGYKKYKEKKKKKVKNKNISKFKF